jgi:glycosyltransferase involved in cell wall biosynthesis
MKNITGYGYMVRDIADYVSRTGVEVDVITTSAITSGRKYNAVTILTRTWMDLLMFATPYYLGKMSQLIQTYRPSFTRFIKLFFYFLSAGYVEHILRVGNYDIVHIHGIGFANQPYIDCCNKLGQKYVITLHGLNSFSDSVLMENCEKQFEKDFLQDAYNNNIHLSAISTGILNVIKGYLGVQTDIKSFRVVTNGTDVTDRICCTLDIRQRFGIGSDKEIMLCVGNLSIAKNQMQVVRAYALLPEKIKNCLCIMFLGDDRILGELDSQNSVSGLEDNIIFCGNISRDEIGSYYKQSNFTVLASISEGFGLSIIEGFVYGLPNLTYSDLDAIVDLFDEKAMIAITDRSDEALAAGIVQMLSKKWDREYIKQYAKNFSLEHMAQEYVAVYKEIVEL